MTDRTTKILLALIALGLWANAVQSSRTSAQPGGTLTEFYLRQIQGDISRLIGGTCPNQKLC